MTSIGYRSMLETATLYPKKKHFKKILTYIQKFEEIETFDPQLFKLIIDIGIQQKYPVLLGKSVKHFI